MRLLQARAEEERRAEEQKARVAATGVAEKAVSRRPDHKAAQRLVQQGLAVNTSQQAFGLVPGIELGHRCVHQPRQGKPS